jgi:TRAP transporter TAXI family solute receptor
MHFVVRADRVKGAKTVGEWLKKGGVMSIGEPGSSVQANTQVMLKVFGMTFNDLKGSHKLSQTESSEALKYGVIDAMFVGGDVPVASVSDTTQSVDAVILPFTEEDIKKFQQLAGYQFGYYIRANSYRGQTNEVYTVAYPPLLMVRSDLDSEIVYKIVKSLHENINELTAIHPGGREWVLDTVYRGADWAKEFGYKFHPGIIKYLKEKKSWNPKYE